MFKFRWTQQPSYVPLVDFSNPLTKGLQGGILPNINKSQTIDPISKKLLDCDAYLNRAQVNTLAKDNIVFSKGNASSANFNSTVKGFTTTSAVSLFAIVVGDGSSAQTSFCSFKDSGGGGYIPVSMYLGDGTNARINGSWRDSGGTTRYFGSSPETTQVSGGIYKVCVRFNSGEQTLFVNGIKSSSSASSTGSFTYAPDWLTSTVNASVYVGMCLAWNRYITDSEAFEITTSPWQIFQP